MRSQQWLVIVLGTGISVEGAGRVYQTSIILLHFRCGKSGSVNVPINASQRNANKQKQVLSKQQEFRQFQENKMRPTQDSASMRLDAEDYVEYSSEA